jgi:hypothetical protein
MRSRVSGPFHDEDRADAQIAGEFAPGVAAVLSLLLGDSVAAGDAIAAQRTSLRAASCGR